MKPRTQKHLNILGIWFWRSMINTVFLSQEHAKPLFPLEFYDNLVSCLQLTRIQGQTYSRIRAGGGQAEMCLSRNGRNRPERPRL